MTKRLSCNTLQQKRLRFVRNPTDLSDPTDMSDFEGVPTFPAHPRKAGLLDWSLQFEDEVAVLCLADEGVWQVAEALGVPGL